ncbi:peroxisomal N(1)-acetyl-spermine/spermidine oxidase isoform X1 [Callorhinchus milii]|nr:peroxisomal N(1)-acetyl-spermine/spermidine oxidase isoform X1 [Callorhinchus milii]
MATRGARKPLVVVIGCGISGLAAAAKLRSGGRLTARVLEASGRPGGRIHSRDFAKGMVEIGAQWIHGPSAENAVFQLACQHNLLDEKVMSEENQAVQSDGYPPGRSVFYSSSGKRLGPEITGPAKDLYSCIHLKDQSKEGLVPSLGEFLKLQLSQHTRDWKEDEEDFKLKLAMFNMHIKLECCLFGSHSLDEVGLEIVEEYRTLPGIDCVFPGGFSTLIDAMMKSLPENIVSYNKPVKCIHWNGSFKGSNVMESSYPVLVECENGEMIPADHVIVTVPLGFLKERYETFFHPQLPSNKIQSIQKMGFGLNNKIFLEFEEPFWEPEYDMIRLVWEDESPLVSLRPDLENEWFRKISIFLVLQPAEIHGHVLLAVLTGDEAEFSETLSDLEVKTCLTRMLRRFTGNSSIPLPKNIVRSKWHSEPYTKGSYSYNAVGSTGDDIDMIAQPLPFEPTKAQPLQVLFAGEATHRTFYSTTHGALESGWREADRLIDHYSLISVGTSSNP